MLKQQDYKDVFSNADIRAKLGNWRLVTIKNEVGMPRLGLSISKKIIKRAVDRNRFKRLAREVFRNKKQHLVKRDFVIMANRNNLNKRLIDNSTLTLELNNLFEKI